MRQSYTRRRVLKSGVALAGISALGFPAISYGQSDSFRSSPDGFASPSQDYQGYQPPSYAAQPGQPQAPGAGVPQWQAIASMQPAEPKQRGEKGFIGSLFDFSFTSLVTPKIIRVLYILFTIWTALLGLSILVTAFGTATRTTPVHLLVGASPAMRAEIVFTHGLTSVFVLSAIFALLSLANGLLMLRSPARPGRAATRWCCGRR